MPKKTYIEGKFKEILLEEFGYKKQNSDLGYFRQYFPIIEVVPNGYVTANQLRPGVIWPIETATRMNQLSRQYNTALARELEQSSLFYQGMYAVQEQRALTDENQ